MLRARENWRDRPDSLEEMSSALVGVWICKPFSDSRWVTMGSSSRTIVAGLLSGLHAMVAFVRQNPVTSDWHIGGPKRLTPPLLKFCVIVSMASYVSDAALSALLEDPRLLRTASDVSDAIDEELHWLETRESPLWDRLASTLGDHEDATGFRIRSLCISAGHVSAAFIHHRFLAEVDQLPWRLAIGDQDANLEALKAGDKPTETVSAHRWTLLRAGFNRGRLKQGLDLLLDISWSTACTEQSHAMAACLKKFHHKLGRVMLVKRASVVGCRKWLPALTVEYKQLAKVRAKIESLSRARVGNLIARNMCFAGLMHIA